MKSKEFKIAVREIKEQLKGKILSVSFVNGNKSEKITCGSLKEFGNVILRLEGLGVTFNFIAVENDLTSKHALGFDNFTKALSKGKWSVLHFQATTVK